MTKRVSEKPKIVMGEFLGLSHPQVLDSSTPKTNSPRPAAESTEPTTSSFGVGVGPGASVTLRVMNRMKPAMKTSPTNTTRHVSSVVAHPPTIGPTAIPAPATPPITAYAALRRAPSKLPAIKRSERGNTSPAPMPSSTDHPRARTATVCDTAVSADPQA